METEGFLKSRMRENRTYGSVRGSDIPSRLINEKGASSCLLDGMKMNHSELAEKLFLDGYNCSQAVVLAFEDVTGLPRKQALMLSSSFGGGMGRLREVCGAVSGAFMVLGLLYGYTEPEDQAGKRQHYARIQHLAAKFRELHGSIVCRELLKKPDTAPTPSPRTERYYHERPCQIMVRHTAMLVDQYIQEHPL